jgi:unsaturated rhamnogalacturonyl hydrolase
MSVRIVKVPAGLVSALILLIVTSSAPASTLVNFADFSSFAAEWSRSGCTSANSWCDGYDYNISGSVDSSDLALFSENWLTSKDHVLSDDIAKVFVDRGIPRGYNRWVYDNGFALISLYEKYKRCHNPVYLKYLKDWVDVMVDSSGNVTDAAYKPTDYNLDMILCGRICLAMYNEFGEQKYKLAADHLINNQLGAAGQPRTADGGFWHKKKYPGQMWLDGLFMAEPFVAQYGRMFDSSAWIDESANQLAVIASHTADPSTGLLYHAWADWPSIYAYSYTPLPAWSYTLEGHTSEFWGRAIGWYSMALVDCLDYLPADHPRRQELVTVVRNLTAGLATYQDPTTHMWWQVVNKGYPRTAYPTNWVESSCTGMFSYSIGKALEKGYLDPNYSDYYRAASRTGYEGLVANKVSYDTSGYVKLTTICGSTSAGPNYAYYVGLSKATDNDFRGLAALMRAALQYEKMTPVIWP